MGEKASICHCGEKIAIEEQKENGTTCVCLAWPWREREVVDNLVVVDVSRFRFLSSLDETHKGKTIEMYMPALSSTMEEGTIVQWLKEVGDKIEVGCAFTEPLFVPH